MSGGEWRRGGDPANPPIDRVGVWECRTINCNDGWRYWIDAMDHSHKPKVRGLNCWDQCQLTVGELQSASNVEWRYVGPADGTEQPEPAKGDREPYKWLESDVTTMHRDNIRSAWRDTIRERDSLASQLEEARKEAKAAREETDANRMWREQAEERMLKSVAERDALKQRVEELEKVIQEASDICSDTGWRWNHEEDRNDSWLRWLVSRLSPETETIQLSPDAHLAIARMERRLLDLNDRVKALESRQ